MQPAPNENTCSNTCPVGYTGSSSGNMCKATQYCHSSCSACTIKADRSKCTGCASGFTPALTYETLNPVGLCVPNVSDSTYPNVKFLTSIDKDSVIGQGYLQSVIYNGINKTTFGTSLSSILFKTGNLLNFDSLVSTDVTFNLINLGINHHKLFIRFNA